MLNPKRLHFYYDIVCPFAYIASTQINRIASSTGASVEWKPVLLGGIYDSTKAPQGKDGSATSMMNDTKKKITKEQLLIAAQRNNVQLGVPQGHPQRTLQALRLLWSLDEASRTKLTHRLFKSYWIDGEDLTNEETLKKIAKDLGIPIENDKWNSEETKNALKESTEEAVSRGAFGVPTFWIEDPSSPESSRMFYGQDRLHFVERALGNKNAAILRCPSPSPPLKDPTITFFFDFSSPWAYIGSTQIERIAREANARIEYVPILLGALFKEIGTPIIPMQAISEARRDYGGKDMTDWLNWWGGKEPLPFQFNTSFPIRTVLPLRVAIQAPETIHLMYKGAWATDVNIGDAGELIKLLDQGGFDGKALVEKASSCPDLKKQLFANTNRAKQLGVCGVPSYQVNGGYVIWGQDRVGELQDLLAGWQPNLPTPSKL